MKIIVPVKRVPDYQAKIKVKADGSGIETGGIKWIINPFDEIALEEAIRIKERGEASEIVVVSASNEDCSAQLRYALALGADRALQITHSSEVDSQLAAKAIAAIFKNEQAQLIIMGKQAIDSDAGQTAQICSVLLGLPLASFASKILISSGFATVTREIDGGLETLKVSIPAVISTDLRLNEPRYATLPGQMKAKKKPLDTVDISSLISAEDLAPKIKILKMMPPSARQGGRKVPDVQALYSALKNEAKVI